MKNVFLLLADWLIIGVFASLFAPVTGAFAQSPTIQMTQTTRDQINLNGLNVPKTGTLYGMDGAAGKIIGTPYLDTTWQAATVKFYGNVVTSADSLTGVPVRLDLMRHDVEIRIATNDIRSAQAARVQYVVLNSADGINRRFVNVGAYKGETDGLAGFVEAVVSGNLTLLEYPWIYVKKPNFNMALNTGTKDTELLQKADWYVAQNGQTVKFSPGKKALLQLMANKKAQVETFLKTENPDLKSRPGLMAVFGYYNGL